MQQSYFTSQVSFTYKFSVVVSIFNSRDFQSLKVIKSEYLSMTHTLGQGVNWSNWTVRARKTSSRDFKLSMHFSNPFKVSGINFLPKLFTVKCVRFTPYNLRQNGGGSAEEFEKEDRKPRTALSSSKLRHCLWKRMKTSLCSFICLALSIPISKTQRVWTVFIRSSILWGPCLSFICSGPSKPFACKRSNLKGACYFPGHNAAF